MNFNDKEYWTEYYNKVLNDGKLLDPSHFAKFILEQNYVETGSKLIELGCGNGRDSIYFAQNNIDVISVDQCENIRVFLNKFENIQTYISDFTNLTNLEDKVDTVYSRFTMHSIDAEDESRTISWTYRNLKAGGKFCCEARTLKDPIFGKGEDKGDNTWFYNGHHRRFVSADEFKNKLENAGFKILFFQEKSGFAKMGDDDPVVLRVIAEK